MNRKHLNSEKRIDNNFFKIKFGSTNYINPTVIYIEGRTFLQPMRDLDDYNSDINHLRYLLKDHLRKELSESNVFENRNDIIDFDIAVNGLRLEKKSFLTIQIYLKQSKELSFNKLLDISKPKIEIIADKFADDIVKQGFALSKTK